LAFEAARALADSAWERDGESRWHESVARTQRGRGRRGENGRHENGRHLAIVPANWHTGLVQILGNWCSDEGAFTSVHHDSPEPEAIKLGFRIRGYQWYSQP